MSDYMKFDVRVLERKLKSGEITKDQYKKYLNSLEDADSYVEIDEDAVSRMPGSGKKTVNIRP